MNFPLRWMMGVALLAVMWCAPGAVAQGGPPPEAAGLAREFPEGTYLLTTRHFVIVHDTSYAWAENRGRMLETAYVQFYRAMRQAGFTPQEPKRRLVCVAFREFQSFLDYALRTDGKHADWAGGYYSTRTNRIAVYNYLTTPKLQTLANRINVLQAEATRLSGEITGAKWRREGSTAGALSRQLGGVQRELLSLQRQYERRGGMGNIANTLHEAIHMLAFNSGIQSRRVGGPLWFSEGLATGFETLAPVGAFGPSQVNPFRQPTLVRAMRGGRLMPLEQFITATKLPAGEDARGEFYAQAWGLFHYLYNTKPARLVAFGEALAQKRGRPGEAELRRVFAETIGEPGVVERGFRSYILKRQ
jgi:hypothetical protein